MTGTPDHNRPAFDSAAKRLREQGHFVINPVELSAHFGSDDEIVESFAYMYGKNLGLEHIADIINSEKLAHCIMSADLAAVRSCDAIYLLRGWETSRGAKKELAEAIAHGLTVMQEGDEK
jgi:hypothetical protein